MSSTARMMERVGPVAVAPNDKFQGRIRKAVLEIICGKSPSYRPPWRSEAVWKDVVKGVRPLTVDDLEWIATRVRAEGQQANATAIEILTACRRERRQAERRRLA